MGDLVLRPSTDDDVDAMVDVARRRVSAVTGRPHPKTAELLRSMRSAPWRDESDAFPVVTRADRVVGFAVFFAAEPFSEIYLIAHADPDLDRPVYARVLELLVEAGERYARRRVGPPPRGSGTALVSDTLRDDVRMAEVLTSLGFVVRRHGYEMVIDLERDRPEPTAWPEGIDVRRISGPDDAEAVSSVLRTAFQDHQGDMPFTPEMIAHLLGGPDVRLDVSTLALDPDGPVGAILCRDQGDHGYVWVLGVLRRGRRRGLAQALLTHALADYAATGTTTVTLEVEADSLTGATRVYERAGMSVRTVHDTWARPLARPAG